jgi:hypothetical protein
MESAASIASQEKEKLIQNASLGATAVEEIATPVASIPVEPKIEKPIQAAQQPIFFAQQAPTAPPQSQANLRASGNFIETERKPEQFEPAVIVYDPNPKINAAVHTMINMGFTNEDNWLTQLMVNVDGDIPKALNFLTPQPKNVKKN